MKQAWKQAWQSRVFRNKLALSLFALAVAGQHNFYFLNRWQLRKGAQLNDWLLNQLTPIDFSVPIFVLIYGVMIAVIISLLNNPNRLVIGLQVFALMTFCRTMAIYFFPLEPPAEMIYLRDPVGEFFLVKEFPITKDLFFSGHTASLCVFFLMCEVKWLKWLAGIALVLVPTMILWQHVHYTIDVIAAPVVTYVCYRIVLYLNSDESILKKGALEKLFG